ncbi:MAG: AI-2E family transporter [Lachnospiraceae bacterium]|nr:AI-2E family transporter [Lachnospiraceae bacterium]
MIRDDLKKMLYRAVSGFGSLALAIMFYFLLLRFSEIKGVIRWIAGILTPFVYGGVMAYLLKTPCNFFEQLLHKHLPEKQKKRAAGLAVLIVLLLAFLILYLLLSMVVPELLNSIAALTAALPGTLNDFSAWITKTLDGNEVIQSYINTAVNGLGDKLRVWAQQDLMPMLQSMMGGFAATVSSVVGVLYNLFIGVIVCIYLLCSRKTFARQGKAVLYALFQEHTADKVIEELRFIDKTFVGFFGGKILDSAIVGLICYAFCLLMSFILDFPNAMLVSVIVGVTNIIPYFGPFIGAVPSALLILISSPLDCVVFLIFIVILQQIDGNILGPRLLADSVGLSGFWVLFSITLFGGLFGFTGILVGVPVFAVIYDLIRRAVVKGLRRRGRMDVLES